MKGYGAFKIVIGGEGGTGKSSLITRVKYGIFKNAYDLTIGGDIIFFDVSVNQLSARLMCWDCAGQSRFSYVRQAFYRGMKGFIIAYDISRGDSFDAIHSWFHEFRTIAPDAPFILVGCKADLDSHRSVSVDEAQSLANELGAIGFIETSSKTGINTNYPFEKLTEEMISLQEAPELQPSYKSYYISNK